MFGGPTFMSLSRGAINSLSKDSQPAAGIPSTIDLNTGIPNIGPPKADATLSNIADKGPVIGTGPYGPYTQKDVDAMANMMAGEAANQGVKGMAAVGAVAGNRAVSNYNGYGKSISGQISKEGQFLGYNNSSANSIMKGTDPQSKAVANRLKQKGGFITTWGGRRYECEPPIIHENKVITFEYNGINILCQGSAADETKQAVINYANTSLDSRLLLQVHDEIVICCHRDVAHREMAKLKVAMEGLQLAVPMLSTGEVGYRWGEMEEYVDA
jgi:hypothetical protein